MMTRAMLMVSHPDMALEKIGRDTVLERQIKTASRAGIEEIWLGGHKPANFPSKPLPPALTLYWISSNHAAQKPCLTPYLALSDQHLIDSAALEEIASGSYDEPTSFTDEQGRMVVQVMTPSQGEFRALIAKPLPKDSYILLERPFAIKGILEWAQRHPLKLSDPSPGIFGKIFDFFRSRS